MSTKKITHSYSTGDIRYEVSVTGDIVNLRIYNGGRELSFSTNPQSARLLASDILKAADKSSSAGSQQQSSDFLFDQ